ncbi:MAG: TonB-dependent receptor [Gammaproteobacteria bacterium]|nr:TonB-dependent receptor [Gammaproteobacteria bacterium]
MRFSRHLYRALILLCLSQSLFAATDVWQGRPLSELLSDLNGQGYQIIFSSDVVTNDLLIEAEPDLTDPLAGLRDTLAAHGLMLDKGPATAWVVRKNGAAAAVAPVVAPPEPPELPEIVVTSSLHRLEYRQTGTQTYLDRELATRIPAAAEEAVRITNRLPSTASGGISSRNHIRGGEPNEVLFLLDGLRLYEPFHLKDFQSVATIVNSSAIDGIDFYSGAYPARYGDRMSGVMNISLREPQKPIETELSLSFFNASVLSLGTFGGGDRGDWLIAGRRGNLDLIADVIDPEVGSPEYQDYLIHAGWDFGSRAEISANVLASIDSISLNDPDRGEFAVANYDNRVFWLKWRADWNERWRSETIFSFSRISNHRSGSLDLPQIVSGSLDDARDFDAIGIKQDWTYVASRKWMLTFGVDGKRQEADYRFDSTKSVTAPFDAILDNVPVEIRSITALPEGSQYSGYLEARWQLLSNLIVDAGLRWDYQSYTTAEDDTQSSPRLSVLYQLGEHTDIRLGWGQYSQAQEINELQVSDGIDAFFPAQRAEHVVANLKHRWRNDINVDVSYYRKSFRTVRPRFENAFNSLTLLPELQFDRYRIDPVSAVATGAELMLSRGDGGENLFWWIGYAWSEVRDKTPSGYTARSWDQTHTGKAGLSWRWGRWDLSAAGEVHTGWPKTVMPADELNALRYSVFHTLDVRVSRKFDIRRGDLTAFLEVSNLYNRKNPCCTEYSVVTTPAGSELLEDEAYWLPLVPSLGIVWRF